MPNAYCRINFDNRTWGYEGNPETQGSIFLSGSGYVGGEKFSYASVGGTTIRVCD